VTGRYRAAGTAPVFEIIAEYGVSCGPSSDPG